MLQVSYLESLDKMSCYDVDFFILRRLLQGYKIPKVEHLAVDEVYARGPKQKKEGETRDDLFFTVIVDIRTHKVIWISKSRRKEALDQFFQLIGTDACNEIKVVATDQHGGYSSSVYEYCKNAVVVLDRFHLVQAFNEALNDDRKLEAQRIDPEGQMGDLINGKYRYLFLTKADNRSKLDKKHIEEVMKLNEKMAKMELIKERFHQVFDAPTKEDAEIIMAEIYQWSFDAKAYCIWRWIMNIREDYVFGISFRFDSLLVL